MEDFDIVIYELQHTDLSLSYSKCWGKVAGRDDQGNPIMGSGIIGASDGFEDNPKEPLT